MPPLIGIVQELGSSVSSDPDNIVVAVLVVADTPFSITVPSAADIPLILLIVAPLALSLRTRTPDLLCQVDNAELAILLPQLRVLTVNRRELGLQHCQCLVQLALGRG
jgi:hypothetical protein